MAVFIRSLWLCVFVVILQHATLLDAAILKDDKSLIELLKKPSLDEQELDQLYFWIEDDPSALFNRALAIWQSLSSSEHILKARLGWLLGNLRIGESEVNLNEVIKETLELIDKNKIQLPKEELAYFQLWVAVNKDELSFTEASENMLLFARKIQSPYARAAAISDMAFEFANRSIRTDEIPALLNELRQITDYRGTKITHVNIGTMYAISATLYNIGETDEAIKLNKKLEVFCDLIRLRKVCGTIYYDSGLIQVESLETESANAAIQKFQKSLELRQSIHLTQPLAESYYGLMRAYNKAKDYSNAIKYGQLAFDIYGKVGPKDWAAVTLKNLSVAYLGNGNKALAEETAQKSLLICPPEIKSLLVTIYEQLSIVYESLHRYKEAHLYLKLFMEQEKLTRTDDVAKKYLELGLKLEEERSAKLKEHLQSEEEKSKLLQIQNSLQARDLVLTHRLRIIAVILLVLLVISAMLMTLAIRRGRLVLKAKAKIQAILDNIDEGLVTINSKMQIMDEHSAYAQRLFPQVSLAGQDVFEVIFKRSEAPIEDVSLWQESLKACLGEDSIAWELNGEHFPQQITMPSPQNKILSLHWQPLILEGMIQSFILSIRDVTSVKALEMEITKERQRREGLQKHILEILSHNFNEAKRLIYELGQAIPSMRLQISEPASRPDLLRRLHTSKGVARSLGLQTLSRTIHVTEDALKTGELDSKAYQALDQLTSEQSSYAYVLEEVLRAPQTMDSLRNLFDTVNTLLPDIDQRMQNASLNLAGVVVHDNIMHWNKELLKDVRDILVHSLANAVDHGFILPLSRGKNVGTPHFKIQADPIDSGILLTITDNGAGLDWTRLKLIAEQKGFVPAADQNLADVLLLDGVSTAENVSETSGRGVGLAAVHSICKERQGRVKINDNPEGTGTLLEIRLRA